MPIAKSSKPAPRPQPRPKELDTDSMEVLPEPTKKPQLRRPAKDEDGADDFWNSLT
jgi:hypothetical protein